jgi:hypothetical protein
MGKHLQVLINVYVIQVGAVEYVIIQYVRHIRIQQLRRHQIVDMEFVLDHGNVNVSQVGPCQSQLVLME